MTTDDADRVDPILDFIRDRDPDADLTAKAVAMRLNRAAHWIDLQIKRQLAPYGIEFWELDILATLSRLGGSSSIGNLQDAAQVTAGAITNRVARLERKGFVVRAIDRDDRRQITVRLTDPGRARASAVLDANDRAQRDTLAGVDPDLLVRLQDDLRRFLLFAEGPSRGTQPASPRRP